MRAYILNLRERGAARGTFKGTCWFAPKNLLEGAKRLLWGSNRIGDRGRIVPAPGSKLAYWVIGLSASTAAHPLQLLATCSGIALTDHEAISGDAPL